MLSSYGIIAATIDENILNGEILIGTQYYTIYGEVDARAILILEHLKQFNEWNKPTGPDELREKIDMSKIMIVGHSRGGEAVGHASNIIKLNSINGVDLDGSAPYNLGPYNDFKNSIKAVAAIAPTDEQYTIPGGPFGIVTNYFIMSGSQDGDVYDFQGYKTYDRAHTIDILMPNKEAEGFKALLWIHGANHNFFNSVWSADYPPPYNDDDFDHLTRLSATQQQQIAKVYLSALAQGLLLNKHFYIELIKEVKNILNTGWIPYNPIKMPLVNYVSQYQDKIRLFINHYEEDNERNTTSLAKSTNFSFGKNDGSSLNTWEDINFQLMVNKDIYYASTGNIISGYYIPDPDHLYQETNGTKLEWIGSSKEYIISMVTYPFNDENKNILPLVSPSGKYYTHLALRIGQSYNGNNTPLFDQQFNIRIEDLDDNIADFISTQIIFPDNYSDYTTANSLIGTKVKAKREEISGVETDFVYKIYPKTVMQTIRIQLEDIRDKGVNIERINKISFLFNITQKGTFYLDEIQLSR